MRSIESQWDCIDNLKIRKKINRISKDDIFRYYYYKILNQWNK